MERTAENCCLLASILLRINRKYDINQKNEKGGNCDAEVDEMISEFKFNDHILMEINGKKFYFTHGHKYNIENIPYDDFDIMIYGHIHQGFIEEKEGLIFANPGSISLPKCNTAHSYIILDENMIILKDVDGKVIQEYEYNK